MSVRRWKESLGKEGLGVRKPELGRQGWSPVFPPFSTAFQFLLAFGKRGHSGRRSPTFTKSRNRGKAFRVETDLGVNQEE